jgi:hypothetical protein
LLACAGGNVEHATSCFDVSEVEHLLGGRA